MKDIDRRDNSQLCLQKAKTLRHNTYEQECLLHDTEKRFEYVIIKKKQLFCTMMMLYKDTTGNIYYK